MRDQRIELLDFRRSSLDSMPEGATWDKLMYEINFKDQVHEGLADVEVGRIITTEALLKRMELRQSALTAASRLRIISLTSPI
jgi:hypothetical protein